MLHVRPLCALENAFSFSTLTQLEYTRGARIYRGVHENMGVVKIHIPGPILENNRAFESSRRVTCHVIMRFPHF